PFTTLGYQPRIVEHSAGFGHCGGCVCHPAAHGAARLTSSVSPTLMCLAIEPRTGVQVLDLPQILRRSIHAGYPNQQMPSCQIPVAPPVVQQVWLNTRPS